MTEIIKIRVLDLKRKMLSRPRPVRYPPGRDFIPFFRRIVPGLPRKDELWCFVNCYDRPVQRLGPDAFPPSTFWHVCVVMNSEEYIEDKASLFSQCEDGKLSEDVGRFLYDDAPPNFFETPFHSFAVRPLAISLEELFHGYSQVISFHNLENDRFELKYHDEKSVFRVVVSLDPGEANAQPFQKEQVELLKDIASLDLPFEVQHINNAFETDRGMQVEHLLEDGTVQLKTFVPKENHSDEQQSPLKYKDSGNRINPMDPFGDDPLSRRTKNAGLGKDILKRITGEIRDTFQAGPNDIYILSYEQPEARIWRSTLEKRMPDGDDVLHLRSEKKPGSFVWIKEVDSFFVSKSGSNRLYLFSPASVKKALLDVSRVFSTYRDNGHLQAKFEAYGEVRDLFMGRSGGTIFLVVAQSDRIGFFSIQPN